MVATKRSVITDMMNKYTEAKKGFVTKVDNWPCIWNCICIFKQH